MNSISSLRFLVIVTIATVIPMIASADANLTPEQLVLLMKASREQYNSNSIDAKMEATSYQYDANDETETNLRMTREIVSRWTRKKSYSRIVRTTYPDVIPHEGYTPTIIETSGFTPKRFKRLIEVPDNRTPRGVIRAVSSLEEHRHFYNFYTIYGAMWDFFGWPWEKMNLDKATVTRDEKNDLYIMKVQMGSSPKGRLIILYIDPSKNFIPVKKEFLTYDGTLLTTFECSDFRQPEIGLWIPYQYSVFAPRVHIRIIYEVLNVKVNEPIADDLFDFEFPIGTIVYDEILNLRYKIEDVNRPQSPVVDPCSEVTGTAVGTLPVKEEALVAAASRAKELLAAHASADTVSSQIEVSPLTVLVTPDKYEYKISIKGYSDTKPVLLSYKFEGDGLELSALNNLIDNENRLLVNVNRLRSHTGFASGILFLYFEGENKPVEIRFVSAPLANAQSN